MTTTNTKRIAELNDLCRKAPVERRHDLFNIRAVPKAEVTWPTPSLTSLDERA
jgi:hypothetical protein